MADAQNELIDGNTLKRVRGMLKHGKTGVIRDTSCPGLAIRVNKARATWMVMARDLKAKIAGFDAFGADDIQTLRELVTRVRQLKKEGRDAEVLIAEFLRDRDLALAGARADVKAGIGENWEDVRDGFLAWCERNRRPDTVRGYRSALGAVEGGPIWHDFAIIRGKPAVSITTKDLVAVRKSISGRGHIRQANLTVSALKTCFNWYFDETGSPLEMSPARPLMKSMDRKQEQEEAEVKDDGGLILTQEQMGLYVWGLSLCRNPAARLASCLQAMTGQRRMTACRARKSEFVAHEQYGKLWRMTPTGDKTHAWRVLPLPEFALQVVEDATVMTRADNPYLFPQQREARVGSGMDGHLSERVVSKVIEDMRKEGGPLHGLPFLPSTHTLRRTMISVLGPRMGRFTVDGRQLERKDVEMITHADEGREGTASQIYDKSQYLDVKYAILQGWQEWVMEGYAMVLKKRGEPGKAAA